MTAQVSEAPQGPLYTNPRGLYAFQETEIARAYLKLVDGGGVMAVWDTGTGKSHLAMALASLMYEDDLIDLVLLVAEKNKIAKDEWPADLERFSQFTYLVHHGTGREKRLEKRLAKDGMPQVLITTYETGKSDIAKVVKIPGGTGKSVIDGPLAPALKGLRILVVLDESTKVKNHSADLYKAWWRGITQFRKGEVTRVLEMTATPIERDWYDAFNQLRLGDPKAMPLVKEFKEWFVSGYDPYGRPYYRKGEMHKFAAMARPHILRVRKTDPEVIDEFPKQIEESRWFDLGLPQRELYEMVADFQEPGKETVKGLNIIKRMVANHPASLIHSAKHGTSAIAKMIVEELGEDYLRHIGSVKEKGLIDYLEPTVLGQGAKAIVFSFFGPSLLPVLANSLRKNKHPFKAYITHGGMTIDEVAKERTLFKTSVEPCVLLSSDAGARGINLPQATYVVEFESALTFAMRTQRINRAHRIDSEAESVTCMTFFSRHTVEQSIAENMIERNSQQDILLDDNDSGEDFISALDRRRLLQIRPGASKRQKQRSSA